MGTIADILEYVIYILPRDEKRPPPFMSKHRSIKEKDVQWLKVIRAYIREKNL